MPVGNAFAILKSVKIPVPMVETFININQPGGLAFDSGGNLFAVCSGGTYINKIEPNGTMTTFTQIITSGEPIDSNYIAIDNLNNIYTTDSTVVAPGLAKYHNNIYRIDSNAIMTTYLTGAGLTYGICIDKNMNLYVTDSSNHQVNKYDSNKTITANFGNAFSRSSSLRAITLNSNDDLYFCDNVYNVIQKITKTGTRSDYAGSRTRGFLDGTTTTARFDGIEGICCDEFDNLYVSDRNNKRIRKITPSGTVTTIAGNGIEGDNAGVALQASFKNLNAIAYKNGAIYISDKGNNKIKKLIL